MRFRLCEDSKPTKLNSNLTSIKNKFIKAWSADTAHPSYRNKWSSDNPTAGQCAVTALVLNDLYGWDIYNTMVGRSRHFYNVTQDGNVVDLTAEQFGNTEIPYDRGQKRDKNELFKSADVKQRYKLLKSNLTHGSTNTAVSESLVRLVEKDSNSISDFGTGEVVGDSIWDDRTHTSFYDALLTNPKYMAEEKNLKGEIVMMSPKEYFNDCATKVFNTDVNKLIKGREANAPALNSIKDLIVKYKRRVFMPYINYAEHEQEGLHRMYVAAQLFGWDHKFPVLVVNWVDEERAKSDEQKRKYSEIDRKVSKAINSSLEYKYSSANALEELKEQLLWDLERQFGDDMPDGYSKFEVTIEPKGDEYLFTVNEREYTVDRDEVNIVEVGGNDIAEDSDEELNDLKNLSMDDYIAKYLS